MKFEIKSRFDSSILFSVETDSLKVAVELAVKQGADLAGAYLAGADLRGAYLAGADLAGADLTGAYLRGAYLAGADLAGAYLGGAYLRGADLAGADLAGADLRGAEGLDKLPIQILGHKHAMWTTQDGELQIGCHKYSFDYWLEHAEAIGRGERYSHLDVEIYKLHIAHIAQVARLLWKEKKEAAA